MSYQQSNLTAIANAIRKAESTTALIKATDFSERIKAIPRYATMWQPDPLWWDIKTIIAEDATPGYIGKLIIMVDDQWLYHDMKGADAYKTSDGAFYKATSRTQTIRHMWQPSAFKIDSRGYTTKYVILLFSTEIIPSNLHRTTSGILWCYPIYAVGKDFTVPFANFLSTVYALQGYDHINCKYTGASASGFLGGAAGSCDFLQSFPDDMDFSGVTNFSNAINSRRLMRANLSTLDFTKLGATLPSVLSNCYNLDIVIGNVDLSNFTGATAFVNWQFIRKVNVTGIKRTVRLFSQSTMPRETMLGIVNNLPDLTAQAPITVSMFTLDKTLTAEEISNVAATKNITLTA